jgi:hypothetical protein
VLSRAFDPVTLLSREGRGLVVLNWIKLEPLGVPKRKASDEGASIVELSNTGAPIRQCFATSTGTSGAATGIRDGALDSQGRLALTGWIWGNGLSFGGESISAPKGYRGSFLAVLTDSEKHAFSNDVGGATRNDTNSVAVDAHGNVAVTGSFFGTLKLGAFELTVSEAMALYVAKFDARGRLLWVNVSPFAGYHVGPTITFTDTGNVLVRAVTTRTSTSEHRCPRQRGSSYLAARSTILPARRSECSRWSSTRTAGKCARIPWGNRTRWPPTSRLRRKGT